MFHPAVLKTLAPILLLGAAAAFAPAIASAAYGDSPNSVVSSAKVVRFHDLNLGREDDVATLYARIRRAAVEVCSTRYASAGQRDCSTAQIASDVPDYHS